VSARDRAAISRAEADLSVTDSLMDMLERRIAALEAVVATPWPWRILAAWRLGRALRRSVRPFPGRRFAVRRTEAVTNEWLAPVAAGGQR
jgi:hypothetical protein